MKFEKVLKELKENKNSEKELFIKIEYWNNEFKVGVQYPYKGYHITEPYLYKTRIKGDNVRATPWTPSQEDLFTDKWIIIE